jgi:hypothetical protein
MYDCPCIHKTKTKTYHIISPFIVQHIRIRRRLMRNSKNSVVVCPRALEVHPRKGIVRHVFLEALPEYTDSQRRSGNKEEKNRAEKKCQYRVETGREHGRPELLCCTMLLASDLVNCPGMR